MRPLIDQLMITASRVLHDEGRYTDEWCELADAIEAVAKKRNNLAAKAPLERVWAFRRVIQFDLDLIHKAEAERARGES